jgi:hypothetical protein
LTLKGLMGRIPRIAPRVEARSLAGFCFMELV